MKSHMQSNATLYTHPPCLDPGEMVVLLVNELTFPCRVHQTNTNRAVIVPDKETPELETAISKLPIEAQVKRANGELKKISIDSAISTKAMVISVPSEPITVNRRDQIRYTCKFKVETTVDGKTWFPSLGVNISEGGMLACRPVITNMMIGQQIVCRVTLPDSSQFACRAIIKRLDPLQGGCNPGPPRMAVQFLGISLRDADKIVGFIFREQAKARMLEEKK